MKNLILALPLLLVTPSCETVEAVMGIPGAAIEDVKDVTGSDAPADDAAASQAGSTVGTIVTLGTGNPALGAGVGAVVALGVGLFLKRRKQAA